MIVTALLSITSGAVATYFQLEKAPRVIKFEPMPSPLNDLKTKYIKITSYPNGKSFYAACPVTLATIERYKDSQDRYTVATAKAVKRFLDGKTSGYIRHPKFNFKPVVVFTLMGLAFGAICEYAPAIFSNKRQNSK